MRSAPSGICDAPRRAREKNPSSAPPEPTWQEGAGSLLLLAAAHETGVIAALERALPVDGPAPSRLARSTLTTRHQSLLTLLFLPAVGLRRTRDLRRYTGDALALLTGRRRAYGYWHMERFLSQVAQAGGDEPLTTALAQWTATLWPGKAPESEPLTPCWYLDGHKKPVYTDRLIPRGLVGRTGKVLGCRALMLLHDVAGHPLLATTHRGDLHLTQGVPVLLTTYEQATGDQGRVRLVVDREGVAAEWLAELAAQGWTVITILRTDQYQDLASFTEVSAFEPLCQEPDGTVTREVASARYALPLPDHPGQTLPLAVALIRDLRRQVPRPLTPEEEEEAEERAWRKPAWWHQEWKAEPTPALPTTAKLIPIVTTAEAADAVELVQTYTRRWPVQENIIRDWLLPFGLDINHGYRKAPVVNSEVSKKRATLEKRLNTLERWTSKAKERSDKASRRYDRLWKQTKAYGDEQYRVLNDHQDTLREQGIDYDLRHRQIKAEKAQIDAELEQRWQRVWRAYHTSTKESQKAQRYAHQQCDLLRALEDLKVAERTMYELDHRKDHLMTICKLALTNLVMWARDHYFPQTYAHATWQRLRPFFQLPGAVTADQQMVRVTVRPFNDRHLNEDLTRLCERVSQAAPHLPDGRQLRFTVGAIRCPILEQQKRWVA